jgi:hypothetical protein
MELKKKLPEKNQDLNHLLKKHQLKLPQQKKHPQHNGRYYRIFK